METFKLFHFTENRWINLVKHLETSFKSLEDFEAIVNLNNNGSVSLEFKTLNRLIVGSHNRDRILNCLNFIREMALELPELFPNGRITRLNSSNEILRFTRRQILCLLSHMFLCTLKGTPQNAYWVTFQNWLTDGRDCAFAYLQCLIGYFDFEQCMQIDKQNDFWDEKIVFARHQINPEAVLQMINDCKAFKAPIVRCEGKIGDTSTIEVDFANKDIGFGIYGTQEEIMFGSSPEMCIAMLFCDTMLDNEIILIRGAQKIGKFDGYGSSLKNSLFPFPDEMRNERIMIAMDALDFSSHENPYEEQFTGQNLERELCKLVCGYSAMLPGSSIDTGNWGCGAFCGDKHLKSILQMVAASVANVQLNFFTFGDTEFSLQISEFVKYCIENMISVSDIWLFLKNFDVKQGNTLFKAFYKR